MVFVVAILAATLALVAIAVVARLRDPVHPRRPPGRCPTCWAPGGADRAGGCCWSASR